MQSFEKHTVKCIGSQCIKSLGIVWLLTLLRLECSFIAKSQTESWCWRIVGICVRPFMIAVWFAIAHTKLQNNQWVSYA